MRTILILAGKSRRFHPLTDKPLFPICGRTLAEHQVERLRRGGCNDIILVVNPENEAAIKSLYPDLPIVVQTSETLGMHQAFLQALPLCGSDPVLLVSSNDFIDPAAYTTLLEAVATDGVNGAILAAKVDRYFPGGYLTIDGDRVTSIVEKPGEGNEPSDLVNIVAHAHRDASVLLRALQEEKTESDDRYERALDRLLKNDHYKAVPYAGPWRAVKFPWHLLPLLELLLGEIDTPRIHPSAKVHRTAVVEGNVIIEENVRILPHATVVGPCLIGAGSIVGNNALVRQSSIGQGCVVGYNTEVKSSVLAGPVWTHMTYLGDSVIGRNVSFGGGCITGNLRLDEGEIGESGLTKFGAVIGDGCRFGIQIGINPGINIGSGTFVSGGAFITEDIPDGSFVVMKDGKLEIRKNRTAAPAMEERGKYAKKI